MGHEHIRPTRTGAWGITVPTGMAKMEIQIQSRRAFMAERYSDAFGDLPVTIPPRAQDGDMHAWHLYVLRLDQSTEVDRETFITLMAASGVGCSVHFIPLHIQPYWRDTYDLLPEDYPNAL